MSSNITLKKILNEGAELHMTGDLVGAEQLYRQALELDNSSAVAHNNLAFLLIQRENFDEAENEYLRAIELSPSYSTAYTNLGQAYLLMQRWDEAEKYLVKATELQQDEFHAHESLAKMYMLLDKMEQAEYHWQVANHLRPITENLLNQAHCLVQQHKLDTALNVLHELPQEMEDNTRFHGLLGIIFFARYDFGTAIKCFKRALGLEPEDVEIRHNLAMAYLKTDQNDKAVTELRRILLLSPDHTEARNNLAVIEFSAGKLETALESFRISLEQEPENAKALYYTSVLLIQRDDIETARHFLQRIVSTNNNDYREKAAELLNALP
jgi:Flp pilus assembly protein TadD